MKNIIRAISAGALVALLAVTAPAFASVVFDGTNDQLRGTLTTQRGEPLTFACWIRIVNHPIAQQTIMQLGNTNASNTNSYRIQLAATDNSVAFASNDTGGTESSASGASAAWVDDTWLPVIGTIDNDDGSQAGNARTVRLVSTNTSNDVTRTVDGTLDDIALGESLVDTGDLNGKIAECVIWTGNISSTDEDSYVAGNCPSQINSANIIAYWSLKSGDANALNNMGSDAGGDLTASGNAALDAAHPTIGSCSSPPTYTSGPTETGITNGYNIAGTLTGTGTLISESVGTNPGASTGNCTQTKAGQDGAGVAAPLNASETWTTAVANDYNMTAAGSWPAHKISTCGTGDGGDTAVTTEASLLRSEDANQNIVTLSSALAASSPFVLQTVANCDTTNGSPTVTGCGSTAWLEHGMRVDLSAGFADLTDIIVEDVTVDTIRLEINANATSSNITVNQDTYFSPSVAQNDIVEIDETTSEGETVTLATDGTISFTPVAAVCMNIDYNVQDVSDTSDGDFDTGPPQWSAGDDKFYIFCDRPEIGAPAFDPPFLLYKNVALSGMSFPITDPNSLTTTASGRSGTPTGTTVNANGTWTGTPTVEDENGDFICIDAVNQAGLWATSTCYPYYVTDDSITMPTITDGDAAAAITDMLGVRPWLEPQDQATFTYSFHATVPANTLISQNPAAASTINAVQVVSGVISLGPEPEGGRFKIGFLGRLNL